MFSIQRKKLTLACAIFSTFAATAFTTIAQASDEVGPRRNEYPIVLIHGFMGWCEGEMLMPDRTPFLYWGYAKKGAPNDIMQILNNHGYSAYETCPSPILEDRQRAIQIYAQLTGTQEDFGAANAAKFGYNQFGVTHKPTIADPSTGRSLFCKSGSIAEKVHLLGHSQGGPTTRVLVELLTNGDPVELQYAADHPGTILSPLFVGGMEHCIESVTTESAPHDGTSFTYSVMNLVPNVQEYFVDIAALVTGIRPVKYDFGITHWGIVRNPGESWQDYLTKVTESQLWTTPATSLYSLSPEGAAEQNQWVKAAPNVYYFSVSTELTHPQGPNSYEVPDSNMFFALKGPAILMGRLTYENSTVVITSQWTPNDGLVNEISQHSPNTSTNPDPIETYESKDSTELHTGTWYYLGKQDWDHGMIVGLTTPTDDLVAYYENIADLLGSLPPTATPTSIRRK